MKKTGENKKKVETTGVSRRDFLTKGVAVAATGASIIAIKSLGAASVEAAEGAANQMLTNDPVFTESTQTLINKTISSRENTLGSDDLYVKEFSPDGTDITDALNAAIAFLVGNNSGGRILIPRGNWTTLGGHEFGSSISIEGFGVTSNGPVIGTSIQLVKENSFDYVFRIRINHQNCSLKNITIDLENKESGIGLLMTNYQNTIANVNINFTSLKNVQFRFGEYGIKVDSCDGCAPADFECILNRFENVSFIQCQTAFYCNSINGGYSFDTCYFQLPEAGTALDCKFMGCMALDNCVFVGISPFTAHVPPTDGTTILRTFGAFVSISFNNCQDENVQYYYQNDVNGHPVPIVFRNCLIQSSFKFTSYGVVIFDSCSINITDIGTPSNPVTRINDSAAGGIEVYLKGATNLFKHTGTNTQLVTFVHPFSRVVYESRECGLPVIKPITEAAPQSGVYSINENRGAVNIEAGSSSIIVENNRVTPDTLVFAQLRTADSGGARISNVQCFAGYYQINLNQNAANRVSVGFKVEGANF